MDFTIKQLTDKFKDGSLTPTQYISSQLNRLKSINPKVNAVAKLFNEKDILKQAQESTNRYKNGKPLGPFDGIAITIKDTTSSITKGVQLHKGSMVCYLDKDNKFFGGIPKESVKEVAMLQKSGAIILCLTTVPEMCWKGSTSSYLYGITRNPHNLTITTGASSGDAAALTALGIGNISVGSDGAGSIRIPASFCGVIGYKPSYTVGHSKNSGESFPYLSHCGPITRKIDDIIMYMKNICTYTNKLSYLDFSDKYIKSGVSGMNIAISKNLDGIVDYVDNNVWKCVLDVGKYFESMGANVEFVDPMLSKTKINYVECVIKLWYMGMQKYGEYIDTVNEGKYKKFVDPGLLEGIKRGKRMTGVNELIDVIQVRDEVKLIMNKFHEKYDLLVIPTSATLPREAMPYTEDYKRRCMKTGKMVNIFDCYHSNLVMTSLFNFSHQPAISMPCGYVDTLDGKIPIGVQLVGGMDKDNDVLKAAFCLEKKFKFLKAKL